MAKLVDLKIGEKGLITDLQGDQAIVQRLLEMGLTDDETVEVIRFAPLGDPMEIRIRGYHLSLRRTEAATVLIEKLP